MSYNVRSLIVRRSTTTATALGIGLVVFVLASSQMLANGAATTFANAGDPDRAIVLRKGSNAEMMSVVDKSLLGRILAAPGIRRDGAGKPVAVGEVVVMVALEKATASGDAGEDENRDVNVQLRGIPDEGFAFHSGARLVAGRLPRQGADEVMVGARLRGQLKGLELGQRFQLKRGRTVETVGIFEDGGSAHESEIWGDIELVRASFGREQILSSATVVLATRSSLDAVKMAIETDKQLGLQVLRETEFYARQSEGTERLVSLLGGVMVFFFSIAAVIGATITMYAAVTQRRREIGTLRALGFSQGTILFSFVLEAFLLAFCGAAIGAAASTAMGFVHLSMRNVSSWSLISLTFEPSVGILVTSTLLGGCMGIVGGLFPAIRAARMSPVEAMRG